MGSYRFRATLWIMIKVCSRLLSLNPMAPKTRPGNPDSKNLSKQPATTNLNPPQTQDPEP